MPEQIPMDDLLAALDTETTQDGLYSGDTATNKAISVYGVKGVRGKHGTLRQFIGHPYDKQGNIIADKSIVLSVPDNQTLKTASEKILDMVLTADGKPNGKSIGPFIIKKDGAGFYTFETAGKSK